VTDETSFELEGAVGVSVGLLVSVTLGKAVKVEVGFGVNVGGVGEGVAVGFGANAVSGTCSCPQPDITNPIIKTEIALIFTFIGTSSISMKIQSRRDTNKEVKLKINTPVA